MITGLLPDLLKICSEVFKIWSTSDTTVFEAFSVWYSVDPNTTSNTPTPPAPVLSNATPSKEYRLSAELLNFLKYTSSPDALLGKETKELLKEDSFAKTVLSPLVQNLENPPLFIGLPPEVHELARKHGFTHTFPLDFSDRDVKFLVSQAGCPNVEVPKNVYPVRAIGVTLVPKDIYLHIMSNTTIYNPSGNLNILPHPDPNLREPVVYGLQNNWVKLRLYFSKVRGGLTTLGISFPGIPNVTYADLDATARIHALSRFRSSNCYVFSSLSVEPLYYRSLWSIDRENIFTINRLYENRGNLAPDGTPIQVYLIPPGGVVLPNCGSSTGISVRENIVMSDTLEDAIVPSTVVNELGANFRGGIGADLLKYKLPGEDHHISLQGNVGITANKLGTKPFAEIGLDYQRKMGSSTVHGGVYYTTMSHRPYVKFSMDFLTR